MSDALDLDLAARRRDLRARLQAQRQLIEQRLAPVPQVQDRFPRSLTMRFVTRHPLVVRRLLFAAASGALAVVTARARRAAPADQRPTQSLWNTPSRSRRS